MRGIDKHTPWDFIFWTLNFVCKLQFSLIGVKEFREGDSN